MNRQPSDAERYEAKYTRFALEALNGRPVGKRRYLPVPRYWWAWLILSLLIVFML
jgi:hypothetical protein